MYALILQRLFWESVVDIFYFPIWWYTQGALRAGAWCFGMGKVGNDELAPGLWLVNIFVPMYGQYDWQGRLISFVMRLVQIIVRGALLLVWVIFCLALFVVWLLAPVAVAYGFVQTLLIR